MDRRIIKIQIRLVGVKAMPVIGISHGVPRPVRRFEVFEDNTRIGVTIRRLAPDVHLALG